MLTLAQHEIAGNLQEADLLAVSVVALGIAAQAAALSLFVVTKRLAFIGQGISHAAFGGVGVAAALGLLATGDLGAPAYIGIIGVFCIGAALAMAWLSGRRGVREDTAIGIGLVASMALGLLLLQVNSHDDAHAAHNDEPRAVAVATHTDTDTDTDTHFEIDAVLFGNILGVGWRDAALTWGIAAIVLGTLWAQRRRVVFWAFDEDGAQAFGVPSHKVRALVMVLLALSIVVTMRLAGVLLASAVLLLPAATALRLSAQLERVLALSMLVATVGMVGGVLLSAALGIASVGPMVVLTLVALFAATWLPLHNTHKNTETQ